MGVSERRQREREQRRREILAAARELVLAEGVAALTMDRLAVQTELAKGTLYLHVASRAEVLGLLVLDFEGQLGDALQAAAASREDPLEALEQVGRRHWSFMQEQQALTPLLELAHTRLFAQGLSPDLMARLAEEGLRPFHTMAQLVGKAQAMGRIHAGQDPLELALALAASSVGVMQLCSGLDSSILPLPPQRLLESTWGLILRGVMLGNPGACEGSSSNVMGEA